MLYVQAIRIWVYYFAEMKGWKYTLVCVFSHNNAYTVLIYLSVNVFDPPF